MLSEVHFPRLSRAAPPPFSLSLRQTSLHALCSLVVCSLSPFSLSPSQSASSLVIPARPPSPPTLPFPAPALLGRPQVKIGIIMDWPSGSRSASIPRSTSSAWSSVLCWRNVSEAGGPLCGEQSNAHARLVFSVGRKQQYYGVRTDGCQFSSCSQYVDLTSGLREPHEARGVCGRLRLADYSVVSGPLCCRYNTN